MTDKVRKKCTCQEMKVLYVARDLSNPEFMCPGSLACLAVMKNIPPDVVNIQDCDVLRQSQEMPDWLNGTPLYIDQEDGIPYRGKTALQILQSISESYSVREKEVQVEKPKSKRSMPPQQQRSETIPPPSPKREEIGPSSLDDDFKMEVQPFEESTNSKVTEEDLQKFINARNQSPAASQPQMQQT